MILRGLREGSGQSGCSGCWSLGPARAAIFSSDTSSSTSYISSQVQPILMQLHSNVVTFV